MRIGEATVRGHLASAARKLGARNTTNAVALAMDLSVISS
jgi:DNA-binding CsgD family transcriptional regulator